VFWASFAARNFVMACVIDVGVRRCPKMNSETPSARREAHSAMRQLSDISDPAMQWRIAAARHRVSGFLLRACSVLSRASRTLISSCQESSCAAWKWRWRWRWRWRRRWRRRWRWKHRWGWRDVEVETEVEVKAAVEMQVHKWRWR